MRGRWEGRAVVVGHLECNEFKFGCFQQPKHMTADTCSWTGNEIPCKAAKMAAPSDGAMDRSAGSDIASSRLPLMPASGTALVAKSLLCNHCCTSMAEDEAATASALGGVGAWCVVCHVCVVVYM